MAEEPGVKIPGTTNWGEWSFAQAVLSLTGDQLNFDGMINANWFTFSDKPSVSDMLNYHAWGKPYYGARYNQDALDAMQRGFNNVTTVLTDMMSGKRGEMDLNSLLDAANTVNSYSGWLKQAGSDYRAWAQKMDNPDAAFKGKAASVIQQMMADNAYIYEDVYDQINSRRGMSVTKALTDLYDAIRAGVAILFDAWLTAWQEMAAIAQTTMTDLVNLVTKHLKLGGVVRTRQVSDFSMKDVAENLNTMDAAKFESDLYQLDKIVKANGGGEKGKTAAEKYIEQVLAKFPYGNLVDRTTWDRMNKEVSARFKAPMDKLNSEARRAMALIHPAVNTATSALQTITATTPPPAGTDPGPTNSSGNAAALGAVPPPDTVTIPPPGGADSALPPPNEGAGVLPPPDTVTIPPPGGVDSALPPPNEGAGVLPPPGGTANALESPAGAVGPDGQPLPDAGAGASGLDQSAFAPGSAGALNADAGGVTELPPADAGLSTPVPVVPLPPGTTGTGADGSRRSTDAATGLDLPANAGTGESGLVPPPGADVPAGLAPGTGLSGLDTPAANAGTGLELPPVPGGVDAPGGVGESGSPAANGGIGGVGSPASSGLSSTDLAAPNGSVGSGLGQESSGRSPVPGGFGGLSGMPAAPPLQTSQLNGTPAGMGGMPMGGMPMGGMPMGGMGGAGGKEKEERERQTWLSEDETKWGTNSIAAAGVIGRPDDVEEDAEELAVLTGPLARVRRPADAKRETAAEPTATDANG